MPGSISQIPYGINTAATGLGIHMPPPRPGRVGHTALYKRTIYKLRCFTYLESGNTGQQKTQKDNNKQEATS